MAAKAWVVISWTLLYLGLGLQLIQDSSALEDVVPGEVDIVPYLSAVVSNSYQCQRLCVVSRPCKGVEFNVQGRTCNLYSSKELDSAGQQSKPQVIHLVKENIEEGGVCGQGPCGEGEMCVATDQGYLCLAAVQCDNPEQTSLLIQESVVLNTYSDTNHHGCDLGYTQTDHRSCQIADTWSSPLQDLKCARIPNLITTGTLPHGPAHLTCTSKIVTSDISLIGCDDDELLVDCSIMSEQFREIGEQGVKIVDNEGKAHCKFPQDKESTTVRSVRCCKMEKMECEYLHGDVSGAHDDAVSTVTCYKDSFPLGCSPYTEDATIDGGKMGDAWCSGYRAYKGDSGLSAYAACCSAPGLSCEVEQHKKKPVRGQVTATCPAGQQLTGCTGRDYRLSQKGSYVTDDVSTGVSTCQLGTTNEDYTYSLYITCCK